MSQYHTLPNAVALAPRASQMSLLAQLKTVWIVAKTRRELAKMSPSALADVGISPTQARVEAQRPFWDIAPQCLR